MDERLEQKVDHRITRGIKRMADATAYAQQRWAPFVERQPGRPTVS